MSRKIYIIIAMVFTVVLSVSTFFIIRNHIDSAKQNEVYDNLAEIVEDEPPKENEGVTFSEDKDYLAEYFELYRQNEDMVGWIKVEDTNINYPVVQSVNEPNFYLKHKFDNSNFFLGCFSAIACFSSFAISFSSFCFFHLSLSVHQVNFLFLYSLRRQQ